MSPKFNQNIKPEDMMLDFKRETAEEFCTRIRAFHPWLPRYITYKNNYFIPNPYKIKILNEIQTKAILVKNNVSNPILGSIIDKGHNSITIMCKNEKSICFSSVRLYGFIKDLFINFYIKYCIKLSF